MKRRKEMKWRCSKTWNLKREKKEYNVIHSGRPWTLLFKSIKPSKCDGMFTFYFLFPSTIQHSAVPPQTTKIKISLLYIQFSSQKHHYHNNQYKLITSQIDHQSEIFFSRIVYRLATHTHAEVIKKWLVFGVYDKPTIQ